MERVLPRHAHGAVGLVGGPGPPNGDLVRDDLGRRDLELARALFECTYREVGRHGELGRALAPR